MAPTQTPVKRAWWKEASVYQIYPASYKDSNGDGVGDLPGIISKLDYIKALGVDIVWVCPIFKSPQVDMGYDISDYKDIHEPYGTVADVEALVEGCHSRGMKCLMDLVVNHTSDQHKWFLDAKTSKDSEYRDFYIWRKPKYDADGKRQPPNNWAAVWGGSAWEYDEASDEYYLHIFAPEQPDLNWENDKVRAAVHDIIRFWLDKGVDGFRCDVINHISKEPGLPDAPISRTDEEFQAGHMFYTCGPRLHEYLLEIGKILKDYDAFSVGEMPCVEDPKEILKAVGFDRGELNMIFHFEIVDMDIGSRGKFSPKPWEMSVLKGIVNKWQTFMLENDGWNALYIENHDQSRSVSRWGSDLPEFRTICSKMFAIFLLLQSGTPYIYQGQELGMINVPVDREISEYRDIETVNAWTQMLEKYPNDQELHRVTKEEIQKKSRDNARTPMQWDDSQYAGFSTSQPWQKENESYKEINAASQVGVKDSVFEYWASILGLRKAQKDVFVYGSFERLDADHNDVFAYKRTFEKTAAVVVCNFRKEKVTWSLPKDVEFSEEKVLTSNYGSVVQKDGKVELRPFEAFVFITR